MYRKIIWSVLMATMVAMPVCHANETRQTTDATQNAQEDNTLLGVGILLGGAWLLGKILTSPPPKRALYSDECEDAVRQGYIDSADQCGDYVMEGY